MSRPLGVFKSLAVAGPAVLLLLGAALGHWSYSYYTLLRLVVCGVSSLLAYRAWTARRPGWGIMLSLLVTLFNPVFLVRMPRADWIPFDIAAAVLLVAASLSGRKGERSEP